MASRHLKGIQERGGEGGGSVCLHGADELCDHRLFL